VLAAGYMAHKDPAAHKTALHPVSYVLKKYTNKSHQSTKKISNNPMFMFPNEEQRKNTYCVQFKNYFVN
jgi:hypothetical protein